MVKIFLQIYRKELKISTSVGFTYDVILGHHEERNTTPLKSQYLQLQF